LTHAHRAEADRCRFVETLEAVLVDYLDCH